MRSLRMEFSGKAFVTCPRCGGRAIPTRDYYGQFAECIVCGNEIQLDGNGKEAKPFVMGPSNRAPFYGVKVRRDEIRDDAW